MSAYQPDARSVDDVADRVGHAPTANKVNPTMDRRKFLIGMGTATAASGAVVGTGAYSMLWANRDVEAQFVGDGAGYLAFEVKKHKYAGYDGNQFYLDFGNLNEDANTRFHNVFWIRNNGTNDISVEAHELDNDGNLAGWNQDALALRWSEDNLDEDGGVFTADDGLMHQDEPFGDEMTNTGERNIPRISPGGAISVHPHIFVQENAPGGDDGKDDIPDEIGFYASVTPL